MTDRITDTLSFSSLGPRRVEADFSAGTITTDAGALLLREADRHTGLLDAFDQAIPDPRLPDLVTHSQRSLLAQRIYAIASGYEDLNDHHFLRHDPAWQALAGRDPDPQQPLASAPTLCRLENRVGRPALWDLARVLVDAFLHSFRGGPPPECLVLDFDATDIPIHGLQEGRFFHGYYDHHCFLPLYVFCGDQLLVAYLRPAHGDAARHAWAILRLLAARLRAAWPHVRLILRADSGFCRWRMLRWCDSEGIGYVIGLARNTRLLEEAAPWLHAAQVCYQRTQQHQRLFGEFHYAAGSWDRPRRVIVKAEHGTQGDNPRFVVSNLPGNARGLYEVLYCQRGEMENRIKEQQGMLFAGRTSCHAFLANQFRLLLSAAAYVLVEAVRRRGRGGPRTQGAGEAAAPRDREAQAAEAGWQAVSLRPTFGFGRDP
ncbi:MAG: IS1380 family transposase [Gemmataceae bacterium]